MYKQKKPVSILFHPKHIFRKKMKMTIIMNSHTPHVLVGEDERFEVVSKSQEKETIVLEINRMCAQSRV